MVKNMNANNTSPEMTDIKAILDRYFDATISYQEMERLNAVAKEVGSGRMLCPDTALLNDLLLIDSLNHFAEATLLADSNNVPPGLEARLNAHISLLGAESKIRERKSFILRILSYTAAAAVMGIIGFTGIVHFSGPSHPSESQQILIADISSISERQLTSASHPEGEMIAQISTLPLPESPGKETNKVKPQKKTVHKELPKSKNTPMEDSFQRSELIAEANGALESIPPFAEDAYAISEEAFKVMPTGITAYVETSRLLTQPLSTLSQSINYIYESIELVSEALSGVTMAVKTVNHSLDLLSNPLNPI